MPVSFLMDWAICVCYLATTEKICILNVGFNCYKRTYRRWVRYPLFRFLFFVIVYLVALNSFMFLFPVSNYMIEKSTLSCDIDFIHTTKTKWEIKMYIAVFLLICAGSEINSTLLNALHHHCVESVRIFSHSDWIRTRITPNTSTLYAVHLTVRSNKCRDP